MNKLTIHKELEERLNSLTNNFKQGSDIAKALLSATINFNGKYINFLGISEEDNNMISYLTKDRIEKLDESEYWNKSKRYHTKPSKVVEMLFPKTYSDQEKEKFTVSFRNEVQKCCIEDDLVTIVEGEKIAEYYLEKNYYLSDVDDKANSLIYQSCMRYDDCDNYFDIYVQNPRQVKMAVILSQRGKVRGKVRGRCILWYKGEEVWYDRIYCTTNDLAKKMQACLDAKGFINVSCKNLISGSVGDRKIKLDRTDFNYYPYLDTFGFLNSATDTLYNENNYEGICDYELHSTEGGRDVIQAQFTCAHCGDCYDEDDENTIVAGDAEGDSYCGGCSVYSEYHCGQIAESEAVYVRGSSRGYGDYALREECVRDYEGDWRIKENCTLLYNGAYAHKEDGGLLEDVTGEFFIDGDDNFVEVDGKFYHVDSSRIELIEDTYYLIGSEEHSEALA